MRNLLISYERDMPTVSITCSMFSKVSGQYGFNVLCKQLLQISQLDIDNADVLLMIRPEDVLSYKIASCARNARCLVITFCDDDLLNLPFGMPTIPWRRRGLLNTLRCSDGIMSSSRYILEKYQKLIAGTRMIEINTIVTQKEIFEAKELMYKDLSKPIKIVYAASPAHVGLFNNYIMPIMSKLVNEYGKNISFTFISVRPDLSAYESETNIEYVAGMGLEEYREFMRERNFDIGLAPLNSDDFSKCKYFNKFLEYSLKGVVGVYANKEPYTYVVKDKENGFLANDLPTDWYAAIKTAIDAVELRRRCLEKAICDIEENFSQNDIMKRFCETLPELNCLTVSRKKCQRWGRSTYRISRLFDYVYLSVYQLKTTGIRGFFEKVKVHLREKKAYSKRL